MWIWLTLEVERAVCWAPSFCQHYQWKLCIVIVFSFSVVPLCRDWSSNADRLCVLSAATRLCILSSFRIQLQLFSLIALNCGLHLSDKWKWLIIWPFVFLRKHWRTDFKTFPDYQECCVTWKRCWKIIVMVLERADVSLLYYLCFILFSIWCNM